MPMFPSIGTLGRQNKTNVDIAGGTMAGVTLDGGTSFAALNQQYKLPRNTLATLTTAAGSNQLIVGQAYYITDTDQIAVALTTSTYKLFSQTQWELLGALTLTSAWTNFTTNIQGIKAFLVSVTGADHVTDPHTLCMGLSYNGGSTYPDTVDLSVASNFALSGSAPVWINSGTTTVVTAIEGIQAVAGVGTAVVNFNSISAGPVNAVRVGWLAGTAGSAGSGSLYCLR